MRTARTATRSMSVMSKLKDSNPRFLLQSKTVAGSLDKQQPQTIFRTPAKTHRMPLALQEPDESIYQAPSFDVKSPKDSRLGVVAVIGVANAGKSSLVNALVGQKVAAESSKSHTTRAAVYGILTDQSAQLVFVDTPGIVDCSEPHRKHYEPLTRRALEASRSANSLMLVVDSVRKFDDNLESVLHHVSQLSSPVTLVLNKIDLAKTAAHERSIDWLTNKITETVKVDTCFRISAARNMNLEPLKTHLLNQAQPGKWMFPDNVKSDQSLLHQVEEVIREKVFRLSYKELPYSVGQRNIGWTRLERGDLRIDQALIVPREQHKLILKALLGRITFHALPEIKNILGCHVHLFLEIKVDESIDVQ
eukprot:c11234_g1_i1.p1 GENE.c11234_g1_i1~~c11234_g1_i1.p1  ORF type:complete len:363 (-),score=91.68 c11234_g1_i1:311-1399(-)